MAQNPFSAPAVEQAQPTGLISVEQQRAIAEVQGQLLIARGNPREPRQAMDLILQDCTRVSLAEAALYEYARGGTEISGPSIRLMETIARRWGNMISAVKEISRRDGYSECVAFAWDLETNYRDEKQFQVRHWRDRKGGGGYRVTDERDIYEAIANQGARRKRAALQAVIPGDVVEAAVAQCEETLKTDADTSPEALKKLIEAFAQFGITREQIEARCQRRIEAIRPAQMIQLRKIWASLRDEMSAPSDWFPASPEASQPATGNEALRSRLRPSFAEATQDKPAPPAPQHSEEDKPIPPPDRPREEDVSRSPEEAGISPPLEGAFAAEPSEAEIERSQARITQVLGPEEVAELEQEAIEAAPVAGKEIEVIKPRRLSDKRSGGWDWSAYAEELLIAARKLAPAQLVEFRTANASMVNSLRLSNREEWSRVQQALAEHEREG